MVQWKIFKSYFKKSLSIEHLILYCHLLIVIPLLPFLVTVVRLIKFIPYDKKRKHGLALGSGK